jgi:hypothetical protein
MWLTHQESLPIASHWPKQTLISCVQHAKPQAIDTEVLACTIGNMDELRINDAIKIQW